MVPERDRPLAPGRLRRFPVLISWGQNTVACCELQQLFTVRAYSFRMLSIPKKYSRIPAPNMVNRARSPTPAGFSVYACQP